MSDEDTEEASTDDERPPALNAIPACLLTDCGRLSVHDIRVRTDFTHEWTLKVARDQLRDEGIISGAKTDPILACDVEGSDITLTASINSILNDLPDHHERAAPKADIDDLHGYVREVANSEWTWGNRWKFWVNWDDPDQVVAAKELAGYLYDEAAQADATAVGEAATDGGEPQDD